MRILCVYRAPCVSYHRTEDGDKDGAIPRQEHDARQQLFGGEPTSYVYLHSFTSIRLCRSKSPRSSACRSLYCRGSFVTSAASRRVPLPPPVVVVAAPVSREPKQHASLLAAGAVTVAGGRVVPVHVCLGRFVDICFVASETINTSYCC